MKSDRAIYSMLLFWRKNIINLFSSQINFSISKKKVAHAPLRHWGTGICIAISFSFSWILSNPFKYGPLFPLWVRCSPAFYLWQSRGRHLLGHVVVKGWLIPLTRVKEHLCVVGWSSWTKSLPRYFGNFYLESMNW